MDILWKFMCETQLFGETADLSIEGEKKRCRIKIENSFVLLKNIGMYYG